MRLYVVSKTSGLIKCLILKQCLPLFAWKPLMTAREYCSDRFLPRTHRPIADLPKPFIFNKGTKSLKIDYATTDQLQVYKELIKDAAIRGDNVGVDEYNEDDIKSKLLFDTSVVFQATDPNSGHIEAAMFIQRCLYQRAVNSCSATVHVFRSNGIDNVVYAELASLMGDFAQALDIGYTQVSVHVAFSLTDLYLELRKQGFVTVALFPEWVELTGVGVDDSALMVKQLGASNRKLKSEEEILKTEPPKFTPEEVQSTYFKSGCLQVPILPITVTTRQGSKFTLRNARLDDDEVMYKMLSDAKSEGSGFGVDEFPTLDYFRMNYLTGNIAMVVEDQTSKCAAGVQLVLSALQSRRATGSISRPVGTLRKEFRGLGLSQLVRGVMLIAARSVGFKREFSVTFSTNKPILRLRKHFNIPTCGVFPNGAYQRGHGWVDLVYGLQRLEDEAELLSKLGAGRLISSGSEKTFGLRS